MYQLSPERAINSQGDLSISKSVIFAAVPRRKGGWRKKFQLGSDEYCIGRSAGKFSSSE